MDFYKLIESIKKTAKTRTIWKNSNSSLELVCYTCTAANYQMHQGTHEAELHCDTEVPSEKFLEFCKALEWLRKQKDVINITPSIEAKLDRCLGSDVNEWQYLTCLVTFVI